MNALFHVLTFCGILSLLVACGGAVPPVTTAASPTANTNLRIFPTPTIFAVISPSATFNPMVSFSPTAPPTPIFVTPNSPLYQSVTLTYWVKKDDRIIARVPALSGSLDRRVIEFNHAMSALIDEVIQLGTSDWYSKHAPVDPNLPESYLDILFEFVSPPGNIISLKFIATSYTKGAAHPFEYSRTATYDLETGQFVTLNQLFLSGSDYLGAISAYCIAKFQASEISPVFSIEGALPDARNYRNWNITADGLLITFDEYQVAPYAAGPQLVIVPYSFLQSSIDLLGPLAGILSK